ncbi:MAG: GTPase Era [Spirochaetales bacterium]|nr:GTPase Era [Spirochaetales bacterium]
MKSAFVSLIGRPSAGKSTLVNTLCGRKVSIVSPIPQTTRNRIRGIVNRPEGQLVFIDTPGYHSSEKRINLHMKELAENAARESDIILYLTDASRKPGEEEHLLISFLSGLDIPVVLALNKTDLTEDTREIRGLLEESFPSSEILPISALKETGTEELLQALFLRAPEGEQMYPEDFYTDQDPEFRVREIIREKAFARLSQEVPHSLYVDIADMEVQEEDLWIRAFILVERESQKGIVVGKKGAGIREIRIESEKELRDLFPYHVRLDLRVKTDPKWRKKDHLLKRLIQ